MRNWKQESTTLCFIRTQIIERISTGNIRKKCSLLSKLTFVSLCSIEFRSKTRDKF